MELQKRTLKRLDIVRCSYFNDDFLSPEARMLLVLFLTIVISRALITVLGCWLRFSKPAGGGRQVAAYFRPRNMELSGGGCRLCPGYCVVVFCDIRIFSKKCSAINKSGR